MGHITATLQTNGFGLIQISFDDILFIEYARESKGIFIHTLEHKAFLPGQFSYWLTAIQSGGLETLMPVDRNNALNLARVEILDRKYKKAYFEGQHVKECTIALPNFNSVIDGLKRMGRNIRWI